MIDITNSECFDTIMIEDHLYRFLLKNDFVVAHWHNDCCGKMECYFDNMELTLWVNYDNDDSRESEYKYMFSVEKDGVILEKFEIMSDSANHIHSEIEYFIKNDLNKLLEGGEK